MRMDAIHIENFLSFEDFTWDSLDPHLNVVVGPNGGGKTNLIHAMRAAVDAVRQSTFSLGERYRYSSSWAWEKIGYRGDTTRPTRIILDLALTTSWERELLSIFLACSICQSQVIQQVLTRESIGNLNTESLYEFAAWLKNQADNVRSSFFSGQLIITSDNAGLTWNYAYRSKPQERTTFKWNLSESTFSGQTDVKNLPNLTAFEVWRADLTESTRRNLDNFLIGNKEGSLPIAENLLDPLNWAASYNHLIFFQADRWNLGDQVPVIFQKLEQFIPFPLQQRQIRSNHVWQYLLESAFVFTENLREQSRTAYPVQQLRDRAINLSGGRDLSAYLYLKKMGNAEDRAAYAAIKDRFHYITDREFEIVYKEPSEVNPQLQQNNGQQDVLLHLFPVIQSDWGDVPLAYSGAGIAEALFLSTIIEGTIGRMIFLDEPALNLHPTMVASFVDILQGRLVEHNEGAEHFERSQFIVVTHVPAMVPPDSIENVVRLALKGGSTSLNQLDRNSNEKKREKIKKYLRENLLARSVLFSNGVLLVDGVNCGCQCVPIAV